MHKKQYIVVGILTIMLLAGGLLAVPLQTQPKSHHQDTADMGWWKHDRFGMFIHWGLYSVAAGYWNGKLIRGQSARTESNAHVLRAQWAKLASQFNPTEFNADKWVGLAKAAGMKYLVFTCKHHGGFCMFRTSATPYNIVDATPWHQDPCAALAKACGQQGIRFCAYYSILDWHSPYQVPIHYHPLHPTYTPATFAPDGARPYLQYMEKQVGEIITQYHPALLWFDDPGEVKPWKYQYSKNVYDFVRHLDPTIIINNRIGNGFGDYQTPEGHVPKHGLAGPWETCMTINSSWGYKRGDHHYKSVQTLLVDLIQCASEGGNYLLDVGPNSKGVIPQPQVDRLLAIGKWLKVNGDAIYGTHRSPFKTAWPFGYATQKPGKLFLEVTTWPASHTLVVPMSNKIIGAYMLTAPHVSLKTVSSADGQTVYLPANAPDSVASVVVLQLASPVQPLNK